MDRSSASGSVDRASASGSVDSNDFKIGIHSFPTRHSAIKAIALSKPSSSLVVPLGKTLNGISPSEGGKQMAGNC